MERCRNVSVEDGGIARVLGFGVGEVEVEIRMEEWNFLIWGIADRQRERDKP